MKDKVCVGAIAGAFGVRGDVRLKSFTAQPEDVASYGPLSTDQGVRYEVTLNGPIKNGFSARLKGVTSKEAADALRGQRLYADRAQLPNLPDDEFYHADLIGLKVCDTGGTELGHVKAVHNHGASDLLEIQGAAGTASVLLPFTQEAVPTVDLAAGRIVADPPDDLF